MQDKKLIPYFPWMVQNCVKEVVPYEKESSDNRGFRAAQYIHILRPAYDEFAGLFGDNSTMGEADNAFRMIVVKKNITPVLPGIAVYLSKETKEQMHKEMYYTIATNDFELSAKEILALHRQRGETSENKIKELKNGFNMSYLPTSNFEANAFYFAIGVLAHNLFLLFKLILNKTMQHHTVKTIRYKLYHIAGKVIYHARQITLKVNEQFIQLLQDIRKKAYEMSLE